MRFLAIEHELPSRHVTNAEVISNVLQSSKQHLSSEELQTLEALMLSCFESTGTTVRYHRADGEEAAELASRAGLRAIASAGLDPLDIDLIIYVGIGRGVIEPASAYIFQDMLGLRNATAFDVLDACASWVRGLQLAHLYIESGIYRNVMILNAEFVGRESQRYELKSLDEFVHWHPSITIGEAATATIVSASSRPDKYEASFRSWGEARDLCFVPLANHEGYFGKPLGIECAPGQFVSFGLRLMEFGTRKLVEHYEDLPQFEDFDADIVFGHSASDGMADYVLEACGIESERYQYGHRLFANTISASVPLSMSTAAKSGALKSGDKVLVLTASAGVTTALTKFVFET